MNFIKKILKTFKIVNTVVIKIYIKLKRLIIILLFIAIIISGYFNYEEVINRFI